MVEVSKNQLPQPFNVTYEGEIACVHNGLCEVEKLDNYKKEHTKDLIERLEAVSKGTVSNIQLDEVSFVEEENLD